MAKLVLPLVNNAERASLTGPVPVVGDFFYNEEDETLYIGDGETAGGVAYPGPGSISAADIANGAIGTDQLANDAVTADKLADDAVNTDQIVDMAVTAAKLAATGTPDATTFLRGDDTWIRVSSNPYDFGTITTPSTAFCISFGSITAPAGSFDAGAIA